jgi:predicted secreted protein
MSWVSMAALYFVVWWLVLFATLPFSLRTQDEEGEVTLGTVASAPKGSHMPRAFLRTTIASAIILGAFYGVTKGLGYSFDDIPKIVPDIHTGPAPQGQ